MNRGFAARGDGRRPVWALLLAAAALYLLLPPVAHAHAYTRDAGGDQNRTPASRSSAVDVAPDLGCDLYAAADGNDANSGTRTDPIRSPILLLNALDPGQTGCLIDGGVFTLGPGAGQTSTGGTEGQPKILRPEIAGDRAEISATYGFAFGPSSHDLILKDLDFRRPTGTGGGSLLQVDGDRITLDGVDLTYPDNICLDVGADPRPPASASDPAVDVVIRNSRVHDCGSEYGPPRQMYDSGVHGIYVEFTRSMRIEDNYIYANHNRGIQLYPDADGTIVRNNVLYGNGANLNIGSERGDGIYSDGNLIEDNIISNSVLDGLTPGGFIGDTAEILGNFPPPGVGVPAFDNRVVGNCISNTSYPAELFEGYGFTQSGNTLNQAPQFTDPAHGDFSMPANSPCFMKGPQPADAAAPDTIITSGPSGTIAANQATFKFAGNPVANTAKVQCKIDAGAYSDCASPKTFTALADGIHTVSFRAESAAGNQDQTPALRSFTVDTTAPETIITSGPSGRTSNRSPSFGFSSDEIGSDFQCKRDSRDWSACSSPHTFRKLRRRKHRIYIRAIDAVGNVDRTPASRSFRIKRAAHRGSVRGARLQGR